MANPRLAEAEDIKLVHTDFKNDNWKEAAEEIQEFWDDGVRTFSEMEERGNWSRSHYENVFDEHFRLIRDNVEPVRGLGSATGEGMPAEYRQGFKDGLEFARENPELILGSQR